jgi:hypothetical protein
MPETGSCGFFLTARGAEGIIKLVLDESVGEESGMGSDSAFDDAEDEEEGEVHLLKLITRTMQRLLNTMYFV